ncbi:kita-kyushu lung cancer antigen 1 [Perognathus longimembris pacificus]|uniref:kita-kyushu lung cancer antigen 1 n=1 Tax=Perognathus longimembris pacificus TaxID=214514 RepID=UPI0020191198|nr:kita-kyushu lung cancer antigen 1 [Perognathus longimembris pacificus]
MNIILLLMTCTVFTLMYIFWKKWFQRKTGEIPTDLELPEPVFSSPGSSTDNLSVNNLSRDIFKSFPHSVAIQKRILTNLRMVEYKLNELEHFLSVKGTNGTLTNRKTSKTSNCKENKNDH